MSEHECNGQRHPELGEHPDFYIGEEPVWVCLKCGGCGCPPPATTEGEPE